MSLPVLLSSDMPGAPVLNNTNGTINNILLACLVNGFNTQSVVSASATSGVVTFNFASAPGFKALDTVNISGASNNTVNGKWRVQSASGTQVLVAIAGVPNGAVAGTISMKYSSLGWTRPYSSTGIGCYRQGGGEPFNRFLRIRDSAYTTDNGGGRFRARGYESMTAHSTGTNPFPTTGQQPGEGCEFLGPTVWGSTANTDPRPWVIVGTPRMFHLMLAHYYDNGTVTADGLKTISELIRTPIGNLYGIAGFMFGDLANKVKPGDAYHTVLPTGYSYPHGISNGSLWIARGADGIAGAKSASGISQTGAQSGPSLNLGYPSPSNNGLTVTGAPMVYDNVTMYPLRGQIPGVLAPFEAPWYNGTTSNYIVSGEIITGVTGVTGRLIHFSAHNVASQGTGEFFLALDEDWGDI